MTRFRRLDDRPDPPVDPNALSWRSVPASATASGTAGQVAYDGSYFYVCTATNTWTRTALTTWAPFTPASVTGLQLWLDASDASTLYDATGGGALVAADGIVRRWEDKSGNGRHATESSNGPTRKTAQQNGRDTLLFNGTSTFLSGASTPSSGNVRTAFTVVKSSNSSGADLFQIGAYEGLNSRLFSLRQSHASSDTGIGSDMLAVNLSVAGEQLTINQYHVSTWRQTSSTRAVRYWHNGTEKTVTGTPEAFNAGAGYFVGKGRTGADTSFWPGHIAEVIIYDNELNDTDRAAVESYLATKWAIS